MVTVSQAIKQIKLLKKILKRYSEIYPYDDFDIIINFNEENFKWRIHVVPGKVPDSNIKIIADIINYLIASGYEEDWTFYIDEYEMYSEIIIDKDEDLSDYKTWKKYEKYYPYIVKLIEKYAEAADKYNIAFRPTVEFILTETGKFYVQAKYRTKNIETDEEYIDALLECVKVVNYVYQEVFNWKIEEGERYYKQTREKAEENIREKLREMRRRR